MRFTLHFAVLATALLASHQSSAETARVRSGEHGTFTRLVIQFSERPGWNAGRSKNGYEINFEGTESFEADLRQVFQFIGRDRVANLTLSSAERALHVELACDCHAQFQEYGEQALIVDVWPGAAADNTYEQPVPANDAPDVWDVGSSVALFDLAVPSRRQIAGGLPETLIDRASAPFDLPTLEIEENFHLPIHETKTLKSSLSDSETVISNHASIKEISSAAVSAITEQLSRAAAQGLIDFPAAEVGAGIENAAISQIDEPQNFRVLTSADRDGRADASSIGAPINGAICIEDRRVDLAEWGDPADRQALGKLREAVIAANGSLKEEGLVDLAKYYIVLGFGAEAKLLLQMVSEDFDKAVLLAMADIVDHGKSDSPTLRGQLACNGKIALWAALGGPFQNSELPLTNNAILQTFSGLPKHLREHLGPILSERLRRAGQSEAARMALNAVTRAGKGSALQDLTAARLELTGTGAEAARKELERLAQGADFTATNALLELLLDAERRGVAAKPVWVDDATALVRATEGTELAEKLSLVSLRSHIPLGRFDKVRQMLREELPGLNAETRRDISINALSSAAKDASDAVFLRTEIGFREYASPGDLPQGGRHDVAERYLALGLPEYALRYVVAEPDSERDLQTAATAYLQLGNAIQALELLSSYGNPETETDDLRSDISAKMGRYLAAAQQLKLNDQNDRAIALALRSGDWKGVAGDGPIEVREALQAIEQSSQLSPLQDEGPGNARLIDSVSQRNSAYAQLLSLSDLNVDRGSSAN